MANYYWGMWGGVAATTTLRSTCPPPPPSAGGEPSWEEQAFARDAAGHLGAGCVWPPRSYTCTFCRREFRSAQALGGHMNVHRRDRARLRQCASPPDHRVQPHPTSTTIPHDHHQPADLYRAAAATLVSSPKSPKDQQAIISSTTTSPSYISTIIKESKNKSMPAGATTAREAAESGDDDEERRKRRRVDLPSPPPAVALPFFVRPPASCERADGDAKVPKVITSPSPANSIHLVGRQEVDLELRLGISTPKVA